MKLLRFAGAALVTVALLGTVWVWQQPETIQEQFFAKPCSTPLAYTVGEMDSSFGITKEEFVQALAQGSEVWNKAAGKQVLVYDPTDPNAIPVHLVYDQRQENIRLGPTIKVLITSIGLSSTFIVLGTTYFVIMFASALYLEKPEEGYLPEGFKKKVEAGHKTIKQDLAMLGLDEAIKTPRFYGLWLMLFINVTCGIAIIGVASPLLQEMLGLSAIAAAAAVGLMGIFNGAGRLFWASLSDYLTRPIVYIIFFATQAVAFYALPSITEIIIFQFILYFILSCYGGGFASIPAYIGDIFGTKELGAIHGYILTAWAAAGLVGPLIISMVKDATGSYADTLYVFSGFFVIALVISITMLINIKSIEKKQAIAH